MQANTLRIAIVESGGFLVLPCWIRPIVDTSHPQYIASREWLGRSDLPGEYLAPLELHFVKKSIIRSSISIRLSNSRRSLPCSSSIAQNSCSVISCIVALCLHVRDQRYTEGSVRDRCIYSKTCSGKKCQCRGSNLGWSITTGRYSRDAPRAGSQA